MNRYSSLGAEMVVAEGRTGFSVINILIRPWFTFLYNYFYVWVFLMAAKDCCCIFTTRFTCPGNMRRPGNWDG